MNNSAVPHTDVDAPLLGTDEPQLSDDEQNDDLPSIESNVERDSRPSHDEETLSEYDKDLADSFPASDPPTQP